MTFDGVIPDGNRVLNSVRRNVFTWGHRNMQGIDFAADGTLYAAKQGPKTDAAVNILRRGNNYDWPHVARFPNDKTY